MKAHLWGFQNPVKIEFGAGSLAGLAELVGPRNALLVTTPGATSRNVTDRVRDLLLDRELTVFDQVSPNPDMTGLEQSAKSLDGHKFEVIIGLGGGSALDTAKAFSTLLVSDKDNALKRHFQDGSPIAEARPLAKIAIPTTAGSGSEVTPFATIWDGQERKKYSIDSPDMYSETAVLDPELSVTLPEQTTVSSSLDSLSHALESIWNRRWTPLTVLFATESIRTILKTLPETLSEPENLDHRSALLRASLLSGLAISQTRTALAHSMSYPMTCYHGLPHGLACGFTLPAILDFNLGKDDGRLKSLSETLGFSSCEHLKGRITDLFAETGVIDLVKQYISGLDDLIPLAPEMLNITRSTNNLRDADVSDVAQILKSSWEMP